MNLGLKSRQGLKKVPEKKTKYDFLIKGRNFKYHRAESEEIAQW